MFERNSLLTSIDEPSPTARIRLRQDGVEAYAAPGGFVRLQDKTGRQIAYVGIPPSSTRFLSMRGLEHGTYKVELQSHTGYVTSATFEA